VDGHNAKRYSPISLEVVWTTKIWTNRVFAFLLAITEVNFMSEFMYFCAENCDCDGMLEFQKFLVKELIRKKSFVGKASNVLQRSP
jgi:hypothetical protein